MITYIQLTYKTINYTCCIYTADWEKIKHFRWSITDCSRHGTQKLYVRRREVIAGRCVTRYMHREITQCPDGLCVDHLDGNGLNNCRSNFAITTVNENAQKHRQHHEGRYSAREIKKTLTDKYI